MDNNKIDEGLQGNEKIETAIAALQQEASEEMLAHTLTVIRRRMKEGGQFIIAVEPPTGGGQMQIQAVQTECNVYIFNGDRAGIPRGTCRRRDKGNYREPVEPDDHAG